MISNTQKRAGGGNSLTRTNLTVLKGAVAGQDLYANEAGDIAPSAWFTGTPVFLDNTDSSLYATYTNGVVAGDVASFDSTTVYVAALIWDRLNGGMNLTVKKCNPVTGELLASVVLQANPALTGISGANVGDKVTLQVVPISATQVSVVLHTYNSGNTTYNCSAAKFTVSSATFTNGGWSTPVVTSGVNYGTDTVYFSGVTGNNRWSYFVRPVTTTSAVIYLYKHSTNTITAITFTYTTGTLMTQSYWQIRESSDDLLNLIANDLSAVVVRSVTGASGAQATSNTLNISGVMQSCTGFFSTAAGQLQLFGVATIVGRKYPYKFQAVTIDSAMTAIATGPLVTIAPSAKIGNDVVLYPVTWANGVYVFTTASYRRFLLQPPSDLNDGSYNTLSGLIAQIKGTATVPSSSVADVSTSYLQPYARIEEANWAPAATKRLRLLYCSYYRMHDKSTGMGTDIDKAPLLADFPWLFMPEFYYGAGKNGLAYVGTPVANIADGATGQVVLSLAAVKLNGNVTPVKSIKNGVLAISSSWGVKLPAGQRNDGSLDISQVSVTVENGSTPSAVNGAITTTAAEGTAMYLENQKGSVAFFCKAYNQGNPGAGSSVFSLMAYVDGRLMTTSQNRSVTVSNTTSTKLEFSYNDHLFFTFSRGHDRSLQDFATRDVMARVSNLRSEAKYYE